MRTLQFIGFMLFMKLQTFAQLSGTYQGTLIAQNQMSVESSITLKTIGNDIEGQLVLNANGITDYYAVKGYKTNTFYKGKMTYKDNSAFDFTIVNQNGVLNINVSLSGTNLMSGQFKKVQTGTLQKPNNQTAASGGRNLNRDTRLLGTWYQVKKATKDVYSDTYLTFNQDGTLSEATRTSIVSYGGSVDVSSIGELEPNQQIQALMNQGVRWYTEPNKLCFKAPDGKNTCIEYSFENQYLFIQWQPSGRPAGYKRAN